MEVTNGVVPLRRSNAREVSTARLALQVRISIRVPRVDTRQTTPMLVSTARTVALSALKVSTAPK